MFRMVSGRISGALKKAGTLNKFFLCQDTQHPHQVSYVTL